ncbi:hypothetical protein LIER_39519 [Lithospermum erythrorhizon]|uniref:TF-B3 domain-containing protein n=1 Tax=Lithospermum erythrorhizon TaxID=34254 RepID=A0AAV3QLL0_LITER
MMGDSQRTENIEGRQELVFADGWHDFVIDQRVGLIDMMVFEVDLDRSHNNIVVFDMTLFDSTGCIKPMRIRD